MPMRGLLLSLVLTLWASALVAQQPIREPAPDPLTELQWRMSALERENWELRNMILQQRQAGSRLSEADYEEWLPPMFAAADTPPATPLEGWIARCNDLSATIETQSQVGGSTAPRGTIVGDDLTMTASFRNGVEWSTKDKAFRYHVGGRWQFDTSWMNAPQNVQDNLPGNVQYHDAADFRRVRFRFDGTIYEVIDFAAEFDLVSSLGVRNSAGTGTTNFTSPALTDLWLQFNSTPLVAIRVGNQKEPIGLDHITSSRFLPFMERSYNQDAFYGGTFNGFTPGAQAMGHFLDERVGYAIGVFKPVNNVYAFSVDDGDYAATGRLAWLPIYEDGGRELIHLGISAREATTYNGQMRFRTRDAIRSGPGTLCPVPVEVSIFGDRMQWINSEFIAVYGPWTAQAEWLLSFTSNAQEMSAAGLPVGPRVQSLFYEGGYVQLLYYLTGENDNYATERMALDRQKPFENFFWVRGEDGHLFGRGAWQIGARYNYLNLNNQGINGGILHNLTLGLNWFFNPNCKWQFNYIATFRDVSQTTDFPGGSGWIQGWGMRFAHDF